MKAVEKRSGKAKTCSGPGAVFTITKVKESKTSMEQNETADSVHSDRLSIFILSVTIILFINMVYTEKLAQLCLLTFPRANDDKRAQSTTCP